MIGEIIVRRRGACDRDKKSRMEDKGVKPYIVGK